MRRSKKDKPRYGKRLRHNIREMRKHAPFSKKRVVEQVDDDPDSLPK